MIYSFSKIVKCNFELYDSIEADPFVKDFPVFTFNKIFIPTEPAIKNLHYKVAEEIYKQDLKGDVFLKFTLSIEQVTKEDFMNSLKREY